LQARTVANEDSEGAAAVNETIELWTRMCKAESDRNKMITQRYEAMLKSFEACVSQLMQNIDKLPIWAYAEGILSHSKAWTAQTRKIVGEEMRALLSRLDELENEVVESENGRHRLRSHVSALQDWKRKLEASLAQMVPRSELAVEKAEASQRLSAAAARISELHDALVTLKQEKDQLEATMQVLTLAAHENLMVLTLAAYFWKNCFAQAVQQIGLTHITLIDNGSRWISASIKAPTHLFISLMRTRHRPEAQRNRG
jgi:chromosome segregation ATPase